MSDSETHLDAWVQALESGDYMQTRHALRDDDGYCCLGVACDLYRKATGIGEWKQHSQTGEWFFVMPGDEPNDYDVDSTGGTSEFMPSEVADWLGVASACGEYTVMVHDEFYDVDVEQSVTLAEMNDGAISFKEIAEIIKSKPARLLKEQS